MTTPVESKITLYRGRAAVWARIAASWLTKADEWQHATGPLVNEGLTLCIEAHARSIRNARAWMGGAR